MITILVADELKLFRETLAWLLSDGKKIAVNGKVDSGEAVLKHLYENPDTDIVIMDIQLNGLDGIETTKRIVKENKNTKVILLAMADSDTYLLQGLAAGAKAFLSKNCSQEELFACIESVSQGKAYLSSDKIDVLINALVENPFFGVATSYSEIDNNFFTDKENEILHYLIEGYTSSEIAHELELSVRTVENRKFKMMTKSSTRNVVGLLGFAYKHGLVNNVRKESKSPKDTNSEERVR